MPKLNSPVADWTTVALVAGVMIGALTGGTDDAATSNASLALAPGTAPAPGVVSPAQPARDIIHPLTWRFFDEADRDRIKVWVFLQDKGFANAVDREAAIDALGENWNERSLARRTARRTLPGVFDVRDLPVHADYVAAIEETGADVHLTSRWLNGVSVFATRDEVNRLARLPFVSKIQPVRRMGVVPIDIERTARRGDLLDGGFYGNAEDQLAQINLIALHDTGATAEGIVIGVLDTGFVLTHEAFNEPDHEIQIVAAWDFVNNDPNVGIEIGDHPNQHRHGTIVLGAIAAYEPSVLVGGAFDASFILCKTEDIADEYQGEEDNYVAGLEFIDLNGGDVATSSLGYIDWYTQEDLNGLTAVTTIGVNAATDNGIFCCTAAGNSGHDQNPDTSHLIAPADAFKVFTCGAVEITGEVASFSSDGPTADDRVKPELMAMGRSTWSIDPDDDQGYLTASGTSLSTPLVASAVACLIEAQPAWSIDAMRTMTFATADYFGSGGEPDPMFVYGYGIMNVYESFAQDCNANGVPDDEDITNQTSRDVNGTGRPDECEAALLTDATVVFGLAAGGGTDELLFSDDTYLRIEQRPAFTPLLPLIRLEITGQAETDQTPALWVSIETAATSIPGLPPQKLMLFNYDTGLWELADERTATPGDTIVDVEVTGDPGRFISSGDFEMKMRLDWFDPGNVISPNWRTRTDLARWVITE